jgi:hypothetical protein
MGATHLERKFAVILENDSSFPWEIYPSSDLLPYTVHSEICFVFGTVKRNFLLHEKTLTSTAWLRHALCWKNSRPSHLLVRRKSGPFRVPIFRPANPLLLFRYYIKIFSGYFRFASLSLRRSRGCGGYFAYMYMYFFSAKTTCRIACAALSLCLIIFEKTCFIDTS